ncbi:MAG: hypothetical protein COV66_01075 [Nitrospinae bacterium CG11_big_fil_rev_8_21_14_0_20_45_15]|nr:MAG: hypothetical protein COV66_01075 [Nitrospinae bacterium CG11_big_fil_rev_8_21_14_0_20_45_15]
MAEETNFTPISSDRRPVPTQESIVTNASARKDTQQDNRRADIETRDAQGTSDRVVITQGAIDLSRGGGANSPDTSSALDEAAGSANIASRTSPLEENKPPDITFRNLNGAPNPNDNEVERALQSNPVDDAVQSSRVVTENRVARVSVGDAVEQRNSDRQSDPTQDSPQPSEAAPPERGTSSTQNRIETQETRAQEAPVNDRTARQDANQAQAENRSREQGRGTDATAVQSERGQNLDNLV